VTNRVAGHEFEGVASDRRCMRALNDGSVCGKAWYDVRTATAEDIGKPEKACHPNLTAGELSEIHAELKREEVLATIMVGRW
jgi:hypothetical protein